MVYNMGETPVYEAGSSRLIYFTSENRGAGRYLIEFFIRPFVRKNRLFSFRVQRSRMIRFWLLIYFYSHVVNYAHARFFYLLSLSICSSDETTDAIPNIVNKHASMIIVVKFNLSGNILVGWKCHYELK